MSRIVSLSLPFVLLLLLGVIMAPPAAAGPLDEFRSATVDYLGEMGDIVVKAAGCATVGADGQTGGLLPEVDWSDGGMLVAVALAPANALDPSDPQASQYQRVVVWFAVNDDDCNVGHRAAVATLTYIDRLANLYESDGSQLPGEDDVEALVETVRGLLPEPLAGLVEGQGP